MWDHIPLDILSHIFSFLPPTSIASSLSTSTHWHRAAALLTAPFRPSMWLIAVPARAPSFASFAYDLSLNRWHSLPLDFLPSSVRLVAPISSLLLCKLSSSQFLELVLVNPFTKQYKSLAKLITPRSNLAVGVVVTALEVPVIASELQTCVTQTLRPSTISNSHPPPFLIFIAGGTSGSSYERTVEVYESTLSQWRNVNPMPLEFAIRLTVWTPNESIYGERDGVLYWMTSARAFSVVGFEIETGIWKEVKAPMAERLEWGGLVKGQNGSVGVVGGEGGSGWVWELEDGDEWRKVGELPPLMELGGGSIKCVGGEERVFLFREIGEKTLVGDGREWRWIEGGSCGWLLHRTPMKVVAMQPSLSRICLQER